MPTFAILGATGQIGGAVLKHVLEKTNHNVHCFVRSRSRLEQKSSDISQSGDLSIRMKVYEGDMSNIDVLQECVVGTDVVFLCAAASFNAPTSIAQDQAKAVIAALKNIRSKAPNARMPKLVVLSSAETEDRFRNEIPWPMRDILFNANSNIYNDLIAAEQYLRGQSEWVSSTFVKPGGLSHDIARGHQLSTESQQTFLSFLDLVAGMVEVAEDATAGDKWDGKFVSVLSPSGKAGPQWSNIPLLFRGLLIHYFPWVINYIR